MITSFPTWIIARIMNNFLPKEHPWYKKKFTLKDWHEHETDYTRMFDVMFWFQFFTLLCCLAIISNRYSIF